MHSTKTLAILFALTAPAVHAATSCDAFMASRKIPQPDPEVFATLEAELSAVDAITPCTPEQTLMMVANQNAIAHAKPTGSPEALYGTWLSDFIYLEHAGIAIGGQEVLLIGPENVKRQDDLPPTEEGGIPFEQYWFRPLTAGIPSLWDAEGNYIGRVAWGYFPQTVVDGSEAKAGFPPFDPVKYDQTTFLSERFDDLALKSRLNYFDYPVSFRVDQDSLVIRYQTGSRMTGTTELERTYTRVSKNAPTEALRLVTYLEVSQAEYFACFTHKISDRDERLTKLLSPMSLQEFNETVTSAIKLNLEFIGMLDDLRKTKKPIDRDAHIKLFDQKNELDNILKPIGEKIRDDRGFCPPSYE